MRVFLVGGHGFVGSAYARLLSELRVDCTLITRDNATEFSGQACDVLINANGNSKKFLADRDPMFEFDASVRSVAETISNFSAQKYVFLSSGDVYSDPSSAETTKEDQIIDETKLSRYGLHKYLAEQLVRGTQSNWLVFRMGGFVGEGLKKNAIFDMIHGDPIWLAPESQLQFINTDKAAQIVWSIISNGVSNQTINLEARGTVQLQDLHAEFGSTSEFKEGASEVTYELSTEKLTPLYDGELPNTKTDVHQFMSSFQR